MGAARLIFAFATLPFFMPAAQSAPGILYQVTNTLDGGPGTLRQAIIDANNDGVESGIRFALPPEVGTVIAPIQNLPPLLELTRITGPNDANGEPIIELSGGRDFGFGTIGLTVSANGCIVRNLKITHWNDAGIEIFGGSTSILNCHIGGAASPNSTGIRINDTSNNVIGGFQSGEGNLISGNSGVGILINGGGTDNRIQGNRIGTDLTGLIAVPNAYGVDTAAPRTVIGGLEANAGNLISGNTITGVRVRGAESQLFANVVGLAVDRQTPLPNLTGIYLENATGTEIGAAQPEGLNIVSGNTQAGIHIFGDNADHNIIKGNLVGTDHTGTLDVGNDIGVRIEGAGSENIIGGPSPLERNVISGNTTGVLLERAGSTIVEGNHIGTDITGLLALPNVFHGVSVIDAQGTRIRGNLISANGNDGINLTDTVFSPAQTIITSNLIGTDATGLVALGNTVHGIAVNSTDVTIGGASPEGNVIAGNGSHGIHAISRTIVTISGNRIGLGQDGLTPLGNSGDGVRVTTADHVRISRNQIAHNAGLGIDLGGDGVTLNDDGDLDTGPNGLMNKPTVFSVDRGAEVSVSVSVFTTPQVEVEVQYFMNSRPDPTGQGEGAQLLGTDTGITNMEGRAFLGTYVPKLPGRYVTAVAIETATGNTSEFSEANPLFFSTPSTEEYVDYLLGLIPDLGHPDDVDLNGSGGVDVGDLVLSVPNLDLASTLHP